MVTFPLFITKAKRLEMVSPVFLAYTEFSSARTIPFFSLDAVVDRYTYLGHCDDVLDLVVKGYGTMMRVGRECVEE